MVTRKELVDTITQFHQEEQRFRSIKPGDLVYEQVGRGMDFDYHPAVVKRVNIDKRYVDVIDVSSGGERKKYYYFLTEREMLKEGSNSQSLNEDRQQYKSTIDAVLKR